MDRRARMLELVDMGRAGLEIGALHHPIVSKADASVRYVDHADTTSLHHKYEHEGEVGDIVAVDVVWSDNSLAEALHNAGEDQRVGWVVASHVIEHVPDVIGWLRQIAEVLEPGGVLSLAVPDKRYCFDAPRALTRTADVVGAWLEGRDRPPLAQVYEFHAYAAEVDTPGAWAGSTDPSSTPADHALGMGMARRAAAGEYVDVHCSVFTPDSFLSVLRDLAALDLLPFEVAGFRATEPGGLEFLVSLRRLPEELAANERQRRAATSIPAAAAAPVRDDGVRAIALSPREVRLIQRKRRLGAFVRRLGRRPVSGGAPRDAE